MAKKTVATLQTGSKKLTKVIRMSKSKKTGSYTFEERIVGADEVSNFFAKK